MATLQERLLTRPNLLRRLVLVWLLPPAPVAAPPHPRHPQRRRHGAPVLLDRRRHDAPPRRVGGPPRGGALPRERGVPRSPLHRHAVAARQWARPRPLPPRRTGPRRGAP